MKRRRTSVTHGNGQVTVYREDTCGVPGCYCPKPVAVVKIDADEARTLAADLQRCARYVAAAQGGEAA